MPIVGTAGHVDHGKSTLVRALTGRDPDRWDEEKRRGLTIDLGFAWADLGSGAEVGFVDVPGHERFIKNMLAGVDGIEVALLVVAADEGWMPQTEEHLAVLDLLGVARGIVALSRVDLVDDDLAELATLEVHERLEGTSLAEAPVIRVAAPTGEGVAEVRRALAELLGDGPEEIGARPRLWVDRSFVISGAGTVVTGTLTGGSLAVGDVVAVLPGRSEARIRSLQSHERPVEAVSPGNRTAVNLVGMERHDIVRGAMLGYPGQWRLTDHVLVELRTVRALDEPPANRGAYHLHLGSGAWPVRLRILDPPSYEEPGAALLLLAAPLPLQMGDRFVLRDTGRRAVVAGGRILDPAPPRSAADLARAVPLLRAAPAGDVDGRAAALVDIRGRAPVDELAADSGGGQPPASSIVDGVAIAAGEVERIATTVRMAVAEYHRTHPLRPGMPKASLATSLDITQPQLEHVVRATGAVVDEGAVLRSADFGGGWTAADEEAWARARAALVADDLAVPRAGQLGLSDELFHAALRQGRLVRVAEDLVYLPEQIAEITARVGALADGFSVAAFRDALGVTRRHAVPLLEWLDRTGVTVREGDVRRVRRPPPGAPAPSVDPLR